MINYVDYWSHVVLKFFGVLIFISVNPLCRSQDVCLVNSKWSSETYSRFDFVA